MKLNLALIVPTIIVTAFGFGCAQQPVEQPAQGDPVEAAASVPRVIEADPNEVHFGELRMLTDGEYDGIRLKDMLRPFDHIHVRTSILIKLKGRDLQAFHTGNMPVLTLNPRECP